jgi:murein DD-endopeptidase MepM/ murein hydrolase activator NlpD
MSGTPARAVDPADVYSAWPMKDGRILIEKVAPLDASSPYRWRLNLNLEFGNTTTRTQRLTSIETSFPGTSIPAMTNPVSYYPGTGTGPNPPPPITVPSGTRAKVVVPEDRLFPLPVPATVTLKLNFEPNFDTPDTQVEVSYPLREYRNRTNSGGYRFPTLTSDLLTGEYWTTNVSQGSASAHRGNPAQMFAYDFGMVKYDEGTRSWNFLTPGGRNTNNGDYLVWDKPVYAMHAGTIVECRSNFADNTTAPAFPDGGVAMSGGNSLWIDHGNGEVANYSHFKAGSIPAELCPVQSADDGSVHATRVEVAEGQLLGHVGNSGNSSGPHLHVHVQDRRPNNWRGGGLENTTGYPLMFDHMLHRSRSNDGPSATPGFANVLTPGAVQDTALVRPNVCGWTPTPDGGDAEYTRYGLSGACFQEVFGDAARSGFKPVWVDGATTGPSDTFFSAVFRPTSVPTQTYHGITANSLSTRASAAFKNGFRITHLDSFPTASGPRYNAVFRKESGPAQAWFYGLSAAQHQDQFNRVTQQGYVPVVISVAPRPDGTLAFTDLYEQKAVGSFVALTVSHDQFGNVATQQANNGLKPVYLDGYNVGGAPYLSAIWYSDVPADRVLGFGLTATQVQTALGQHAVDEGRPTQVLTGYAVGGLRRYAAVWGPPAPSGKPTK